MHPSDYLDWSHQTWGWTTLTLHHCDYFLGKQDAIEWPVTAGLLLPCIYLCRKRTWYKSPPGRHKTAAHFLSLLLPYEVPLQQVCSYSYQQVMLVCAPTAVHAIPWEDAPAPSLGLHARKATMKRREQGARTPLETWTTRTNKLQHYHP